MAATRHRPEEVVTKFRQDAIEFLDLAPKIPVRTSIETLPLEDANVALERLRSGKLTGAAVLVP